MEMQPLPWQRQDKEDLFHYEMFEFYLSMRAGRTYKKVANYFHKSMNTIKNIGKKWDWVRRAELYEIYLKENIKFDYIDFIDQQEQQKFESKINLSIQFLSLLEELKTYIDKSYKLYNNKEAKQKLAFVRELAQTLKLLYKMTDFTLDPKLLNTKIIRDINLEKILDKAQNKNTKATKEENYILNDVKHIKLFLNKTNPEAAPPVDEVVKKFIEKFEEPDVDIDKFLTDLRNDEKNN